MKRIYIQPQINVEDIDVMSTILEVSSASITEGGDKDDDWEGDIKEADTDFGDLW